MNIIVTACDDFFFNSFLKLLTSLHQTNIFKIILLDIGLDENNRNLIHKIDIIELVSFEEEFSELDREIGCSYFKNKKTYAFKSYLLKNFAAKIKTNVDFANILYIDSGIYANKSLNSIFEIIQKEEIFCVDHNSEMKYGNIEKNPKINCKYGGCMLLNMLPPLVYEKLNKDYVIKAEDLTKQYIKAGFFGYKYKGKYQHIIDNNLKLFISTLIGLFPSSGAEEKDSFKTSKEKKKLENYYNFNSSLVFNQKIYNPKSVYFYKNLVQKYLKEGEYFTDVWSGHRFDQTILSYLVNRENISHYDSDNYILTSFQKSHFIKYIYFQALFLLERKNQIQNLVPIDSSTRKKTYNLSKLNISGNLKSYFDTQHVRLNLQEKDFNLDRNYFSKEDVIYIKYRSILDLYQIKNDTFTDTLYYNLMLNWEKYKDETNKKILLKTDEKFAVLHRNNYQSLNNGYIINMIPKKKKKMFIMGNGPSLKDIMDNPKYLNYLKSQTTFGLNAAYRAYEKYDFHPTFFGCFDSKVCQHHSKNFEDLILNSPIEKFFFINRDPKGNKIFTDPEIINHPKFVDINFILRSVEEKKFNNILSSTYSHFVDMLTSGTNSVQCAFIEGYKEIYLLGCDCNYVEVVTGAEVSKNTVKMVTTPEKNVNYWMDDYQQKGDVFNLPNVSGCQLPAWKRLADTMKCLNVDSKIYNCSSLSKIEYFEKINFGDINKTKFNLDYIYEKLNLNNPYNL